MHSSTVKKCYIEENACILANNHYNKEANANNQNGINKLVKTACSCSEDAWSSCESSVRDSDLLMSEGHHHDILIVGVCSAGPVRECSIVSDISSPAHTVYEGTSTKTSDGQICALLMPRMGGPGTTW